MCFATDRVLLQLLDLSFRWITEKHNVAEPVSEHVFSHMVKLISFLTHTDIYTDIYSLSTPLKRSDNVIL